MTSKQISGTPPAPRDAVPFKVTQLVHMPYGVDRLGVMMRPRHGHKDEAWGVLNPGCARGRDGALYLYPRDVASGNRSHIGIARVRFDADGNPAGADPVGTALRPEATYERVSNDLYGCEDPRVTYLPVLDRYVMTYVATTPMGPRAALALSTDAHHWERLGLVDFLLEDDVDLNVYGNKDAVLFPHPVTGPDGQPALAILHRPMYALLMNLHDVVQLPPPASLADDRESIWISYANLADVRSDLRALRRWHSHQVIATPQAAWEDIKIGAGPPPLLTHLGWVVVYHGVCQDLHSRATPDPSQKHLRYSAGVLVLDRDDPRRIIYRTPEPILEPATPEEQRGIVANVVFPTGLDPRGPTEPGGRVDVYYGMADTKIGAGCFSLPGTLPTT
jgi:beta-1,2-mannobiose phosphorylase / 1,2-beta-oligomannan phosphorylase